MFKQNLLSMYKKNIHLYSIVLSFFLICTDIYASQDNRSLIVRGGGGGGGRGMGRSMEGFERENPESLREGAMQRPESLDRPGDRQIEDRRLENRALEDAALNGGLGVGVGAAEADVVPVDNGPNGPIITPDDNEGIIDNYNYDQQLPN